MIFDGKTFAALSGQDGYAIQNPDEARRWVSELVGDLAAQRRALDDVDVRSPGGARALREQSWMFMLRVGMAQGAVAALHRTGMITSAHADELHGLCLAAIQSRVVQ